jgi:hypothetical protein
MPSRNATLVRGALASVALLVSGLAQGQAPATTRIGLFFKYDASVALGRDLGVHYQRYMLPVTGENGPHLARIREAEAAGFKVNVTINDISAGEAGARPGPVRNDRAFETALAADLDATHPELVTVQNEEDGVDFWTGTPDDYLHELSDAVQVAHAKGYKISNGGLTVTGVKLAYWHHLWVTGQHEAADRFATVALDSSLTNNHQIVGDVPDSADPGRPILAQGKVMREKLARVERLIAGYPATGVDYVNIHWYESGPQELRDVVTWLSQTTHLPVISNEMGQFSASPETVTALLSEAEALHLPYVFWFATDGRGRAVGLAGDDGAPHGANADAFRAFVAAHP